MKMALTKLSPDERCSVKTGLTVVDAIYSNDSICIHYNFYCLFILVCLNLNSQL